MLYFVNWELGIGNWELGIGKGASQCCKGEAFRQSISDYQRFTAGMLRPYEYICKIGMLPLGITNY
jgi:hypothetical protein